MCGIAGLFSRDADFPIERGPLAAMAQRLSHRGPDDTGFFTGPGVGFAFTRLSIIDLASGNQPHTNEDDSITSVCNGEIYNFLELRAELEAKGHRFRTRCDVEVLVHLYEDHGANFIRRLNGQFAFALHDRRRGQLLLARDHAGIAPLFYTWCGDTLLFASEIKALLAHPAVGRRVDLTGLDQVLTFPGVVSPTTLFQGIAALPPGHFLEIDRARREPPRPVEYWDLIYPERAAAPAAHEEALWVDRLDALLRASVDRRLDADVPVGFYLSGGLDSSLIGALVHALRPERRFHSFSISFPQAEIDERGPQRLMAEHLGSDHHETEFHPEAIIDGLRRAVVCAETPLKESYNTCSLALSGLVRATGHKAVLTGEGADELFAGYIGYRLDATGSRPRAEPGDTEGFLEDELRAELWGDPTFFYERDYRIFRETKEALYSQAVVARLPDFDCTRRPVVDRAKLHNRHPLHQRSYIDFKLRMADHLLADHGDRVAYANSVEARYPFLDLDLMEFARTIPPELLIRNGTEKHLLRQVARRILPPAIANREKFGFVAPATPYLLSRQVEWVSDLLSPDRIRRQNYFNPTTVERLKARATKPGATLDTTFEIDYLMIVLTFGLLLDAFDLPDFTG